MKWKSILGGLAAVAAIVFVVPSAIRHNTGTKTDQFKPAFYDLLACADSVADGVSEVVNESFEHAVNGGVHIISPDSLHKLLPEQPVLALTRTVIDSTKTDTTISIYTIPPVDRLVLQHEYANALSWRHRHVLIGSDTGKFLTSNFYKRCVKYCPRCSAGAY